MAEAPSSNPSSAPSPSPASQAAATTSRAVGIAATSCRPSWAGALAVLALGLVLPGCGHALFAAHAAQATRDLEQAREMGAEQLAPYEYFYAKEHLRKAKQEAAEADYGDASHLAAEAKRYALRAIRVSKERGGAGR